MRKLHLLFMLLLAIAMPWAAKAQTEVTIGSGTSYTYNFPIVYYDPYSFTEMIYSDAELDYHGPITSIAFYKNGFSSTSTDIVVYMKNTEKSAFEVNENNVVLSASDIVFNGSVSFPGDYGWVTINLTTPFTREAGKNLLIGVDKNSDQDLGTGYLFRFTTANNTCWYAYGSSDIDPTTSLSGTVSSTRPNIKISFATTDLPYSVDFDVADDLAPWTIVDGATSTGWCEGEGYDNCFKFAYENGHETQYLISPELGNTATGVNVGFEYKGTNCTFQVGYSTTSNELSAFTWDEAITAPVLFAEFAKDYPADVHYIAIKYNAASSGQLYIDNVSLTVPLLTPTEFAASNITSNSATLTWTGTADSYNLQYKTTDGSWSDIINVTGTSHTLSSLDAATIYEAQLQAVYGEEASAWVSTTFETLPIAPSHLYVSNLKPDSATLNWTGVHPTYNLRYRTTTDIYENFENGLPSTWTIINQDNDNFTWNYESDQDKAHSGSGYMVSTTITDSDQWLVSPWVQLQGTLKFWCKSAESWHPAKYEIYVSTTNGSNSSTSSFTKIVDETSVNFSTYTEVTVDLSSYNGAYGYIAIRNLEVPGYTAYFYVDDWRIYYTETPAEWITLNGVTNPYYFTGNISQTKYEWQVQGANATSTGEPTEWSVMDQFTVPTWSEAFSGTIDDPYQIRNITDWNAFCDALQNNYSANNGFQDKYVAMTANVGSANSPVTTMAGSLNHDFKGTFDGQGHTLYVSYGSTDDPITEDYAAPFAYTNSGTNPTTFRNLTVDGIIHTIGQYTGGLVGKLYKDALIENCVSNITIHTLGKYTGGFIGSCQGNGSINISNCRSNAIINSYIDGDGTHGGFIGIVHNGTHTLNMEGCAFSGQLLGSTTYSWGGFIGWETTACTTSFNNSVFAPSSSLSNVNSDNCSNFVRYNEGASISFTNCYYISSFNADQGKQAYTITGDENIDVSLYGDPTTYDKCNITAYSSNNSLLYDGTIIAGAEDVVLCNISGEAVDYSVDHGTLTYDGNVYTLTMDAYNTLITALSENTITIGTGTTKMYAFPISHYNNYSFSEMIYTSEEIGSHASPVVTKLAFHSYYGPNTTYTITVYMKDIDNDAFGSMISVSDDDVVYTGPINPNSGWVTIELNRPFTHDNAKNMLVAVNKTSGDKPGSQYNWYCTSTTKYTVNYNARDGQPYSPTNSLPGGGTEKRRPNIQLTFSLPISCIKPTLSSTVTTTTNSATITWTPSGEDQTLFDIYWSESSTAPNENTTPSVSNITGTSYTIEGLSDGTKYYVWLRGNCGTVDDPDISGGWATTEPFITEKSPITPVYTCNFESGNYGGTSAYPLPAGWTRPSANTNRFPYVYDNSYYAHSGSRSLIFNGNSQYAILPEIGQSLQGLRLSFYARYGYSNENNGAGIIAVGYMTDPDDLNSFVAIGDPVSVTLTSYQSMPYYFDFNECPNDPRYIAIKLVTTTDEIFVDDVTLSYSPTCMPPTMDIASCHIAEDWATISWTAGNEGQEHWDVYYSTSSTIPTNETIPQIVYTDQNTTTITGLNASTDYYVWVRGNCGTAEEPEYSDWIQNCLHFSTFPWSENFESYTTDISTDQTPPSSYPNHTLPTGWEFLNLSSNANATPQAFITSYEWAIEGKSLYLSSNKTIPLYAILPDFTAPTSELELTFNTYQYTNSSKLHVGYMTDPTDASTFTSVYSCACSVDEGVVKVYFTNVPDDSRVAFMYEDNEYGKGLYLDNISMRHLPAPIKIVANNPADDEMTWDQLVTSINTDGNSYSGERFILMDDIEISTMAGTSGHRFSGIFDGNNHTITANITATENHAAPFRYIDGASILNLTVTGTINTGEYKFGAGIASNCIGNNTFINCVSDVTINSDINGDGSHGGFIGINNGNPVSSDYYGVTVFNGCVFTGKLLGSNTTNCGGFCGWSEFQLNGRHANTRFVNCVFDPEEITVSAQGSAIFSRYRQSSYIKTSNCYYTNTFGTAQGKRAYSITGYNQVTVAMHGTNTTYDESNVVGYYAGIVYNGTTIYAGSGDIVSLQLSGSENYLANYGTLSGSANPYTLNMDGHDTEISDDSCPPPTNITVSNITNNNGIHGATVSWNGDLESYIVNYRTSEGTLGINESFDTGSKPLGWEEKLGLLSDIMSGDAFTDEADSRWYFGTDDEVFGDAVRVIVLGTNCNDWLISHDIEINAGTIFSFKLALTDDYGSGTGPNSDDRFVVMIYADNAWNILREWNNSEGATYAYNSISSTGETVDDISLSDYAGKTVKIAFYAESTVDDGVKKSIHIDDVRILSDADAGPWQTVTVTDNATSAELTDLQAGATYELKICPSCHDTHFSNVVNFTVPFDYEKYFVTEGNWGTATNWEPVGPPTIDQSVVLRANATIESGCVAEAKEIYFEGSPESTLTIADGGQLKIDYEITNYVTLKKNIAGYGAENAETNDGYVLISVPAYVNPDTTGLITTPEETYDLYQWQNNPSDGLEWRNYKRNAFYMFLTQGYLYANQEDTEVSFSTQILANNDAMKLPCFSNEGYSFGYWSLLGNPFVCNVYLSTEDESLAFYRMNPEGDGFIAATGAIAPMEGFFVHNTDETSSIDYATVSRTAPSRNGSQLNINLSKAGTRSASVTDRAIVRFDGGGTLEKFSFSDNTAKLYIPQEDIDYAVVNADNNGELPLNFKAAKNGRYTMDFTNEEVTFSYLHLIDNMTGADIDLLANPSYSFDAKRTDYESRFKLVFATNNGPSTGSGTFAFYDGNEWVITEEHAGATVQIVDVTGRIVYSRDAACHVSTAGMAPGVYVMRLINGNDVKTQKIVVR